MPAPASPCPHVHPACRCKVNACTTTPTRVVISYLRSCDGQIQSKTRHGPGPGGLDLPNLAVGQRKQQLSTNPGETEPLLRCSARQSECINRQRLRFHCIMHSPQYLSSADTSARWGDGGLFAAQHWRPAEGPLCSESFRNLNLCSSDVTEGRSVRFTRNSPLFSPLFSKYPCLFSSYSASLAHCDLEVGYYSFETANPKQTLIKG